ncbi:tetratricopeptide repeat protein [Actinoplanes regularis]|uniref:Tetratricopeptide repeat-containing protein n=1 Tax=Actinoplanes regularis TaxID=52697 RepID=A0A239JCI2_9ACTN|nr:tetratricopeptide repeat protein [Actinoplanes regularis]GIE91805.1 hypothetical protein Are01nite_82850 [Actinoplanes regularis]SNT03547.1 hypothetical protein SAMN06264365_13427 [Actinoplanes regularis]
MTPSTRDDGRKKPWGWPLAGLVAMALGAGIMPVDQLWWYLPAAALGEVFLLWTAWRESTAKRSSDPAALQARLGRALALLAQHRTDAALAELDDLLPDLNRVLGPDHPVTLSARTFELRIRGDRGDLPDRVAAMAELVADRQRVLGPDHEETLTARYQLADWLEESGDIAQARSAYEALIVDTTRVLGADHSATLISRSSLAILRFQAGERDGLAELAGIADDMERALGPADPSTVSTRNLLTRLADPAGPGAG